MLRFFQALGNFAGQRIHLVVGRLLSECKIRRQSGSSIQISTLALSVYLPFASISLPTHSVSWIEDESFYPKYVHSQCFHLNHMMMMMMVPNGPNRYKGHRFTSQYVGPLTHFFHYSLPKRHCHLHRPHPLTFTFPMNKFPLLAQLIPIENRSGIHFNADHLVRYNKRRFMFCWRGEKWWEGQEIWRNSWAKCLFLPDARPYLTIIRIIWEGKKHKCKQSSYLYASNSPCHHRLLSPWKIPLTFPPFSGTHVHTYSRHDEQLFIVSNLLHMQFLSYLAQTNGATRQPSVTFTCFPSLLFVCLSLQ